MKYTVAVAGLALLVPSVDAFVPPSAALATTKHNVQTSTELYSGVERNANFAKLAGGYLFPEIGRRRNAYLEKHPEMAGKVISLGIGDTTQPVPPHILSGLVEGAKKLGTKEGYSGTFFDKMPLPRAKLEASLYFL